MLSSHLISGPPGEWGLNHSTKTEEKAQNMTDMKSTTENETEMKERNTMTDMNQANAAYDAANKAAREAARVAYEAALDAAEAAAKAAYFAALEEAA